MSLHTFDEQFYLSQNPDVLTAVINGFFTSAKQHFDLFGWKELRDPNTNFDTSYYLTNNPDVLNAKVNPFDHFVAFGAGENRVPNQTLANSLGGTTAAAFDEATYLAANADVKAAVDSGALTSGYQHWVLFGQFETRTGAQTTTGTDLGDAGAAAGSTFTLTTGVDNLTGSIADDTFTADNTGATETTSTADSINGGDGTDTLNIFSDGTVGAVPALVSVENLNVYDEDTDLSLAATAQSSVTSVGLIRGDGDLALTLGKNVTNVSLTDIAIKDAGANNGMVINAEATATALTVGVANLSVTNTADEDLSILGTKLASVTVNATGTASTVEDLVVTDSTAVTINAAVAFTAGVVNTKADSTLTVTGAGKVTLGALDNDVDVFNGSANTGGIVITAAAANADAVITLGSGADKFTTDDDGFASTDKFAVNAGDGEDTLVIADDADVSTTDEAGRYTNFEVLQRAINADLDVSVFGAATTITKASIGDGGLTNMQAALAQNITLTADNAGSTFTLKTASGTSDVLTITSANATATASADLTTATIDGFETLNFAANTGSSTDKTAISITTADQLKTVNLSGSNFVVIDVANDTAALTSLNASANTKGATITVGAQTGDLVVTGTEVVDAITLEAVGTGGTQTINAGAGKDVITSTIAIADVATINGGADEDTLSVSDANLTTETLTVSDTLFNGLTSVEVIDFAGSIAGDLVWTLGGFASSLAAANGGQLKITGDTFALGAAADDITIDASALAAGTSVSVDIKDTDGTVADASDIKVTGSDGNDTLKVEEATAASANIITMTGGKGDDTITVKTSATQDGGVIVDAGDGDDVIDVSAATTDAAVTVNLITGGKGNDTIKLDTEGGDTDFTIVTGATAAANGVDTITNFTLGTGGDVLEIDAFLNATAMNAKLTANPAAVDVENDVNLLVDIAGGQDITTADGLTAALAAGGEYASINMAGSSKAVFVTAASSDASVTQNVFFAESDAAGNISVTLVGTIAAADIDSFVAANFNI